MLEITEIIGAIRIAKADGSKLLEYRRKRLSDEEKEMLIAAYQADGMFTVFSHNQMSRYVRAGKSDFYDTSNRENYIYSERFYGAFKSLCQRGYVDNIGKTVFQLNFEGVQKAEELLKKGN